MRQPAPGLVPQSGELGACSPPLARLPHSPVPSRPWRRGQPCSSRPCPGREPGPAPLAWLLGLVLLAHSSGTPWTSVPHPLWSPRLTCQLTPEASPALVRSFHDCLQTPPASVFRPPSCPSFIAVWEIVLLTPTTQRPLCFHPGESNLPHLTRSWPMLFQ